MQSPIAAEPLAELIGQIYDAAIDPTRWPPAIEAIRQALDFEVAVLSLHILATGESLLNVTSNVPDAYIPVMENGGADAIARWGGERVVAALPLDEPAVLSRVNPAFVAAPEGNRYHRDFARPQGLVDVMVLGLARDAETFGSMAFGRHERAGPIAAREIALARLLLPHLQRAVTVNRMMETARLMQSTLASLRAPILLVADDLQVVHANPAAVESLRQGDTVRLVDGRLAAPGAGAHRALAVAIRQATLGEAEMGRTGLGIPVRRRDGSTGALHVLPISARQLSMARPAVAAVFIAQTGTPFTPPTRIVEALFGLTVAEARVFERAARGETTAEVAALLGVGRSTVKTHLLHIYEKLGVRRQADLVQIAISLAPPGPA